MCPKRKMTDPIAEFIKREKELLEKNANGPRYYKYSDAFCEGGDRYQVFIDKGSSYEHLADFYEEEDAALFLNFINSHEKAIKALEVATTHLQKLITAGIYVLGPIALYTAAEETIKEVEQILGGEKESL